MDCDEPSWPVIDDFFAELAFGRSAATVRRYVRVHRRLIAFLETADMTDSLGAGRACLLQAEREFHDSGAFWSLFGSAELVECLPAFLDAAMLPDGSTEARMQVSVVARLLHRLLSERLVEAALPGEMLAEAYRAIEQARHHVETRAGHDTTSTHAMPGRFLQPPGAQW